MNTGLHPRAVSRRPAARPFCHCIAFLAVLLIASAWFAGASNAFAQYPAGPQLTKDGTRVLLQDYVSVPLSARTPSLYVYAGNPYPPVINPAGQLSRINFMRAEPTNAPMYGTRLFICDNNRSIYIFNKTNQTFANYIDFETSFPKFDNDPGFAGGLVTFAFDPEYASNGLFYTVHTENPVKGTVGQDPTNPAAILPSGYTTTTLISPPAGSVSRQCILVEWTDTNVTNNTFEGTAREIMRVGFTGTIHPMGDLLFNPLAQPGDEDYRNLYIGNGDGGAGEQSDARHALPQRLDTLVGKILRITPDLNLRTNDLAIINGVTVRYRVPSSGRDPNPFANTNAAFTNVAGCRKEIFAYGFRNCHRLSWDPVSNLLLENDIGLHSWEEVNLIHKGSNYGYAEREGVEQLFVASGGITGSRLGFPFPTNSDSLTVTGLVSTVTPTYPVAEYSHLDGDAISSGFVYRGTLMPQLYGKYLFGDITTGRLLYCDLNELIAADDGERMTLAAIHELQIAYDSPYDSPDRGVTNRRMFDIVADEYDHKGGTALTALPGTATVTGGNDPNGVPYGGGRADIRLSVGDDGEIYVLSKSDATIRKLAGVLSPFSIQSVSASNGDVTLSWQSVSNRTYRVQYNISLADTNWTDIADDVTATGIVSAKTTAISDAARFYRVVLLP